MMEGSSPKWREWGDSRFVLLTRKEGESRAPFQEGLRVLRWEGWDPISGHLRVWRACAMGWQRVGSGSPAPRETGDPGVGGVSRGTRTLPSTAATLPCPEPRCRSHRWSSTSSPL